MSDPDSLDYLEEGFDAASLSVPRLRSILVTYGVQFPASSKKAQLIEIFNAKVLPNASKILAARARAKRTSKGITDADSHDSTTTSQAEEEQEQSPSPPPSPPRRRITRSTSPRKMPPRAAAGPVPREDLSSRTPRRVSARTGSKHTRTISDTDDAEEQLQRSMRRATLNPRMEASPRKVAPVESKIKLEKSHDGGAGIRDSDVFSHDNPFQSGSTPPSSRRSMGDSRRKTVGIPDIKDAIRKRAKDPARRRTDVPQSVADRGIHPPSAATFHAFVSQTDRLLDVDENGLEITEEFMDEEREELEQGRAQKGEKALGPIRSKKKSGGVNFAGPMWIILMAILTGYAAWYRNEKIAVGYCGVGRPANPLISSKVAVPEWAAVLAEPKCEPCPQHAYCDSDLKTACDPDFVLKSHPFCLGGLVPLPPTCEADSEKQKRVQAVANRAIESLRDRRAKYECGELPSEAGAPAATAKIGIEELKEEVSKKKRRAMSNEEYEELWNAAVPEIVARDEVELQMDSTSNRETLSSSSLALVSASCALRRSFRITLAKYYAHVGFLIISLGVLSSMYRRIVANRAAEARVPELVALTLDRLATQASLHSSDEVTFPEGWISIGQLRDDVLREEHSIVKREKLWSKVRKVVEKNANVRAGQRSSSRNGEISRVWEWIGNIAPVQLPEGSSTRKSVGRFSSSMRGESATPVSGSEGGPRWSESGPIY